MDYRKYLENDDLTAVERAILETLILHYENHDKRLGETKKGLRGYEWQIKHITP